jgi:hypothetical protein
MMATAHLLVAGAIVTKIDDPVLASTLALTSHFILDSIPHWDFGTNWRGRSKFATGVVAIIDTIFGFLFAWILFSKYANPLLLALCLILSVIPDWLEAPWYIFFADPNHQGPKKDAGIIEKIAYGIYKIPNKAHTKAPYPWGVLSQIATVIFFLLVLR